MNIEEAADRVGLAPRTVRSHILAGHANATCNRVGGRLYYELSEEAFDDYAQWLRERDTDRNRAAARIENLEWLVRFKTSPDEILHRVGFPNYEAVDRFCRRHNRPDLNDYFAPYARAERYAA